MVQKNSRSFFNNANRLEMVFNRVGSWFITGLPASRYTKLLHLGTNRGLK